MRRQSGSISYSHSTWPAHCRYNPHDFTSSGTGSENTAARIYPDCWCEGCCRQESLGAKDGLLRRYGDTVRRRQARLSLRIWLHLHRAGPVRQNSVSAVLNFRQTPSSGFRPRSDSKLARKPCSCELPIAFQRGCGDVQSLGGIDFAQAAEKAQFNHFGRALIQ